MAETPSQAAAAAAAAAAPTPPPSAAASDDVGTSLLYWCYSCNKRVSVETLEDQPDVICHECKNGFVESIPASATATTPLSETPSLISDQADDSTFGSQFLQMLRIFAQAARDEDGLPPPPPRPPQDDQPDDDFLRIDFNGWGNDEQEEEEDEDEDGEAHENDNENEENREDEDGSDNENENEENREEEEEEEEGEEDRRRRRRRDMLRLQIRDFATRTRSGRNRILDWAEILMGLEDNSIEFRVEVPESDRYVGNPEDYVDAAGYEQLLQTLAESDVGRRGTPPAAKSAVSGLLKVEVTKEEDAVVCAICKDLVNVGEIETKLPCGHGYHGDCIVPWLGSRNSCPVCRFELPTDDAEYEEEKNEQKVPVATPGVGGASGSGGDDASSSN